MTIHTTFPTVLETKNAVDGDPVAEVKTALAGLTADIATKTAPVAAMTARLDAMEAKLSRPALHTERKDGQTEEAKAFELFLRGQAGPDELKTLTIESPGTGSVIAPPDFSAQVIEKVAEFSPVRELASVIQIGGPLLQIPVLESEVNPASRTETQAMTESEPTFTQVDIKPFEMAVITPVSQVLIEDSKINLSNFLSNHIARRFGQQEASWFVKGNGTSQAEGVLTSTAVSAFEVDAVTLGADDLIDAFYSVKSAYAANGSWIMNRKTMAAIRKLKDGDGQYIWQAGLQSGQPALLLGRPVYEAVDMPDIGADATPIVFGDFAAGYTIADRIGFNLKVDEVTGFSNGIVKFGARRRVGGRVTLGEALTKVTLGS
ncbi:phage major capsid protein [Pseudochrobactrum sp. MP213Fo]|uniref:phage major capsid protein n=1 Tax=Pseudochrobactrum sp. MP213Fo TaxID=3022250 RepID=UPI003B9FC48E